VRTRTKFVLSAAAMAVTACGSSSAKSTATGSPALTPSAAVSAAPALNVTATAEDYTGKPAPAGAVVMTMAALLFNPPVPAGMGTKIVIYIDNKDPDGHDCERFGGPPGSNICYQHGLLVLGPGGAILGKTDTVSPGHQAVLTLDGMRPGRYQFYCPLVDHRSLGMKGLLTVT
jgi:plastocyanin